MGSLGYIPSKGIAGSHKTYFLKNWQHILYSGYTILYSHKCKILLSLVFCKSISFVLRQFHIYITFSLLSSFHSYEPLFLPPRPFPQIPDFSFYDPFSLTRAPCAKQTSIFLILAILRVKRWALWFLICIFNDLVLYTFSWVFWW